MPSVAKINNEVVNEEFYSPTNNTNFGLMDKSGAIL